MAARAARPDVAIGPTQEAVDAGHLVVITRFECVTAARLLRYLWLHRRIKKKVLFEIPGCLAATSIALFADRTLLSISVWEDADAVTELGRVREHIEVSPLPRRQKVNTSCEIFLCAGDWQSVLFAPGNA